MKFRQTLNDPLHSKIAMISLRQLRHLLLASLLVGATAAGIETCAAAPPDTSRENLMVVVRETNGANRQDETLAPMGKMKAQLPDGREFEVELAWWQFIGDLQVRFVFDGPQTMASASAGDLAKLGVSDVNQALSLSMANLKRVYGEPVASPWADGAMAVSGKSPDLNSSYMLDREFWKSLLKQYPDGIVVAVPKRGGLLYVPVNDSAAVEHLKKGVSALYESSKPQQVSSALFLFKDDKWTVFQAPIKN